VILVDTSIWIDFLKNKSRILISEDMIKQVATCPPVIQEVFQGLRDTKESESFKEFFLAIPRFSEPTLLEDFIQASEIYSQARKKGITLRSSTDCLIAAIAIRHRLPVWHKDRDFTAIARITSLKIHN
jgi:predicted nucleic acid-binding protein